MGVDVNRGKVGGVGVETDVEVQARTLASRWWRGWEGERRD